MWIYRVTHLKYCIFSISASNFIVVTWPGDWQGLATSGTIGLSAQSEDLL
jgi:hypothetical protein